ncbi:MAG: TonB-dependent receptor [bacterium]|nr:TonB-dependent receptor [bacterium]
MFYRFILPGVLGLLQVCLAFASDDAIPSFAGDENLPSILSATRLQQSLFEVPAAVTVIDRQMIEQSGMREIPELLRLVPGMVVGYESGSEAFVSFHGTSADLARRMQVLIDGRSIYQPLLASVDWVGLPVELADIERIEVIRGPNSAAYGANSFFAVVNIITRHPADVDRARVSYTRGEDGVEDFMARIAQRSGPVDWRLSVSGRNDDGFQENRRKNNGPFTDSKDVDSLHGRGVWTVNPEASLDVSFGLARMTAEQQYRANYFTSTPVADQENSYLSLAWDQDLGPSNHLRVQASDSRFKRDEPWSVSVERIAFNPALGSLYKQNRACALGLLAGNTSACTAADMPLISSVTTAIGNDPALLGKADFLSGLDSHEERRQVDVQDTWIVTPDFRTVFGLTYDDSQVDSLVYLKGHGENTVWRAFVHGEWRFAPQWLLNVGGNQENDAGAGDYFSPRAALNWQFADNQVLRAVYSTAVRTPDILENQADWSYIAVAIHPADNQYAGTFFQSGQANGTAPTEKIASRELGYYGRFDAVRLALDVRWFYDLMALSEHHLAIEGSQGFIIRPTEDFRQQGVEVGLDWRPLPSQRFQLNYAYLDMNGRWDNDNTSFVPQHSGSAAWWQDYSNGWQFGTTYAFYNDLRANQFYFDRLELRLAKKLNLPRHQQLELAAVTQLRLSDDPELRSENGGSRHRGWFSLNWRY